MRNLTGLVAVSICCLASLALVAPAAHAACEDAGLGELARRADGVFVGTVLRTDDGVAEVRVSDVYRGDPGSTVRVHGGSPNAEDSTPFGAGTQYLFLATGAGATWRTNACAGTGAASDARLATVEKVLGPATARRDVTGSDPSETRSPASTEASRTAAPAGDVAAAESGNGSKILVGVVVVGLLVGSFFLPRLRRRHRRRD